jgi:putative membrane protein
MKGVSSMMFGGGMILGWLVLIAGGYFLVHYLVQENRNQVRPSETPMMILERRYASGEIEREEYLRRKKDLSGS